MKSHIYINASIVSLLISTTGHSCPAFVSGKELTKSGLSLTSDRLKLYTFKDAWIELPVQVDPITEDGSLDLVRVKANQPFAIADTDRIVFETKSLSSVRITDQKLPCKGSVVATVESMATSPQTKVGYLIYCDRRPDSISSETAGTIHDKSNQIISSKSYVYNYLPANQLLFKELFVKEKEPDGTENLAASDSRFLLHLDPKRFFTMDFNNSDIESYVEGAYTGPVGVTGLINFYLRLLLFKIDLKLATLASFYENAANLPMIVDVPKDGPKALNRGSGMFYTFKPNGVKFVYEGYNRTVPEISATDVVANSSLFMEAGLKNCESSICDYNLMGTVGQRNFSLKIVVPKKAVSQGFFPILVRNVPEFKRTLKIKPTKDDSSMMGFYYENSGLQKGRFSMDYWIGVNETAEISMCPSPVKISLSAQQ